MTRHLRAQRRPAAMRALTTSALALALLVTSACGSSSDADNTSGDGRGTSAGNVDEEARALLPAQYKEDGALQVASTFGYPPHEFYDDDGKTPLGLSVEIAQAIGEKLGVEFEFENVGFDSIVPGILANRFDLGITAMSVTPERNAQLNFVTYMNEGTAILVRAGNPENIEDRMDLCGKKVGELLGSNNGDKLIAWSEENCVAQGQPPVELVTFAESAAPFQALQTGRIHATYRDMTAQAWAAQESGGQLELVPGIYDVKPLGMPIAEENAELGQAIAAALNAVIADGTYAEIMKKWGTEDGAIDTSEFLPVTD